MLIKITLRHGLLTIMAVYMTVIYKDIEKQNNREKEKSAGTSNQCLQVSVGIKRYREMMELFYIVIVKIVTRLHICQNL